MRMSPSHKGRQGLGEDFRGRGQSEGQSLELVGLSRPVKSEVLAVSLHYDVKVGILQVYTGHPLARAHDSDQVSISNEVLLKNFRFKMGLWPPSRLGTRK